MESVHAPFEKGLMKKGSQEYLISSLLHSGRGVRHEAASIAVGAAHAGPNLRFCPQYPTRTCDQGNPVV